MDLEERTRDLFAALSAGPAAAITAFLAKDAVFEVVDLLPAISRDKLDPMLARAYAKAPPVRLKVVALKVKRNVVFVGWKATGDIPGSGPGELDGLAVINWDQDGQVMRLDIHLGEEVAARLRP
ncbi:MAG: nuclear transport factor 2 family protein [bacterium]